MTDQDSLVREASDHRYRRYPSRPARRRSTPPELEELRQAEGAGDLAAVVVHLADGPPDVRKAAVRALGRMALPGATTSLIDGPGP